MPTFSTRECRYLFVIRPQTPSNDFSKDEAVSVLKLATELDFPRVRWRAIEELGQHVLQDPVFQLITAKKYDVHQWLVPSLKAIMGTKADLDLPHIISRLSCALEKTVMQDLGPRLASLRRSCLNLLARYPATVLDFTDAICTVFACNPDGQPVERFEDRPSAVGTPGWFLNLLSSPRFLMDSQTLPQLLRYTTMLGALVLHPH
jgi:hypothetical protein